MTEGPRRNGREPADPAGADGTARAGGTARDGGTAGADGTARDGEPDQDDSAASPFPHPPWTVGLVLVAGVITLLFGVLVSPVWLLVGSPFVIALVLWLYVRIFVRPSEPLS